MRRPQLSYANVMSTIAVFVALGGTSWAVSRNSVGNRELKNGAVTSAKVRNGTRTSKDLAPGTALARGQRGPAGPSGPIGPMGPQGPGTGPAEGWKVVQRRGHRDGLHEPRRRGLRHRVTAPAPAT